MVTFAKHRRRKKFFRASKRFEWGLIGSLWGALEAILHSNRFSL